MPNNTVRIVQSHRAELEPLLLAGKGPEARSKLPANVRLSPLSILIHLGDPDLLTRAAKALYPHDDDLKAALFETDFDLNKSLLMTAIQIGTDGIPTALFNLFPSKQDKLKALRALDNAGNGIMSYAVRYRNTNMPRETLMLHPEATQAAALDNVNLNTGENLSIQACSSPNPAMIHALLDLYREKNVTHSLNYETPTDKKSALSAAAKANHQDTINFLMTNTFFSEEARNCAINAASGKLKKLLMVHNQFVLTKSLNTFELLEPNEIQMITGWRLNQNTTIKDYMAAIFSASSTVEQTNKPGADMAALVTRLESVVLKLESQANLEGSDDFVERIVAENVVGSALLAGVFNAANATQSVLKRTNSCPAELGAANARKFGMTRSGVT